MPTIKIGDKTVNFAKEPTAQDIAEASEQLGIPPAPKLPDLAMPDWVSKLGGFLKGEITGAPQEGGILGDIFQKTVGSKGLLGVAQMPGRVIGQKGLYETQASVSGAKQRLADITSRLIEASRQTKDTTKKDKYSKLIQENMAQLQEMGTTQDELQSMVLTPKQAVATAGRAALTVAPFGAGGRAIKGAETAIGIPQAGGGLLGALSRIGVRGLESGITSGTFGGLTAYEQEKDAKDIAKTAGAYGLTGAIFGSLIQTGAEGIGAVGNILKTGGRRIQFSKIRPTGRDMADGFAKENIEKYGLYGNVSEVLEKTESQLDDLSDDLTQILKGSKEKVNLEDIFEETATKIVNQRGQNLGQNRAIERVFEDVKGEILNTYGKTLNIPAANGLKRVAGGMGSWEYGKFDPDASAKEVVYDLIYNTLKRKIEGITPSGEVQALNKAMSEIIPIRNAAIRRIPVEMRNQVIGLKDFIGGLAAIHDPKAAGLLALNILSKSGKLAGAMSWLGGKLGGVGEIPPAGAITPSLIMSQMLRRTSPKAEQEVSESETQAQEALKEMIKGGL